MVAVPVWFVSGGGRLGGGHGVRMGTTGPGWAVGLTPGGAGTGRSEVSRGIGRPARPHLARWGGWNRLFDRFFPGFRRSRKKSCQMTRRLDESRTPWGFGLSAVARISPWFRPPGQTNHWSGSVSHLLSDRFFSPAGRLRGNSYQIGRMPANILVVTEGYPRVARADSQVISPNSLPLLSSFMS